MSDSPNDGRQFRTLNVFDDYNRENLGIEVDFTLPGQHVIRSLQQIIEWRGKSLALSWDNGPEYISRKLIDWANQRQTTLPYIQTGKPTKKLMRRGVIEPSGMGGWIYTAFTVLVRHNCWRHGGYRQTNKSVRIPRLRSSRQADYWKQPDARLNRALLRYARFI